MERKLIELRGDIDAILVQLAVLSRPAASQYTAPEAETTADAAGATWAPAQAMPAVTAAHEETPAEIVTQASSEEAAPGPEASTQDDAGETATSELSSHAEPAAETPTKPTSGLTAALAACQDVTAEEPATVSSDAEVAARGPETPTTEDAIPADTTAVQPPVDAEPEADAESEAVAVAAMDAQVAVADISDGAGAPAAPTCEVAVAAEEPVAVADTSLDVAPEPVAVAAETPMPAVETPAAPAATVISFEPRVRKEKADLLSRKPEAAPRRRRVASRIAAGIVALIAAAGALVLAEREALGGPQALPWVSPLPSYRMPWSLLSPQKRAEGAADTGVSAVSAMVGGEVWLGRFGESWPMSP